MNTVITKEKILFKNGKPDAVILDIGRYEKLLEVAEEKEDLAELKRIKKSANTKNPTDSKITKFTYCHCKIRPCNSIHTKVYDISYTFV